MARREVIVYEDDLTGQRCDEVTTVTFTVDGTAYEIDLGPDSYGKYVKNMERYRDAGRRLGKPQAHTIHVARGRKPTTDKEQNRAVREWWARYGEAAGLGPVVDRGRISADVMAAYDRHAGRPVEPATVPTPREAEPPAPSSGLKLNPVRTRAAAKPAAEPAAEPAAAKPAAAKPPRKRAAKV